ncbi:MAG TPA: hypothetical protein VGX23_22925 [Actinocrinis sp.]|nr:hypothetical protein [Actinocrinis sp.]
MPVTDLALRYVDTPMQEVDVALTRPAALALAAALDAGHGTFDAAPDPDDDPSPYRAFLNHLEVVTHPGGKVTMHLDVPASTLRFTGAPAHLKVLAANIRALAEDPDPTGHLHVEYFEEHYYLAESEPSVIFHFAQA